MRDVSESLAGRAAVLRLAPFSLAEQTGHAASVRGSFADWLDRLHRLEERRERPELGVGEWLLRGGYPPVVAPPVRPPQLWFPSYVQTYLDRDVRLSLRARNVERFEQLVRLLAARSASLVNQSVFSRELGVSVPTISEWLALLEASGLFFRLPPLTANLGKRLVRTPRLFGEDTGLLSFLVGLQTEEHLLRGPMAGALFETAVLAQLRRRVAATLDPSTLWFWRTRKGEEVDIVAECAGRLVPIEIKLTATPRPAHLGPLRRFMDASGDRAPYGLLVCRVDAARRLDQRVTAVPWWML